MLRVSQVKDSLTVELTTAQKELRRLEAELEKAHGEIAKVTVMPDTVVMTFNTPIMMRDLTDTRDACDECQRLSGSLSNELSKILSKRYAI